MKRHRAKTRRALFESERARELRRQFRDTVLVIEKRHAGEAASAQRIERELRDKLSDARVTVERQRELLSHPWRHLVRWYWNPPAIRQRKEVE